MPTCQTMIANNSIAVTLNLGAGVARRWFALELDTKALRANLFIRPKHLTCLDDFSPLLFPRSAAIDAQSPARC